MAMTVSESSIHPVQLLGSATLADFFSRVWEREARFVPGAVNGMTDQLLGIEDFEVLLASAVSGIAKGASIIDGHVPRPIVSRDLSAVYEAFHRGCTLLQAGLELRWQPIARLCRKIENEVILLGVPLAEPVGANAYLTPAQAQGFDIHYDRTSSFVLQLAGKKNWTVFPPLQELPLSRCEQPIRRDDLQPPVLSVKLEVGDVLYIPRGFPHCALTERHTSLHLTISLRPVTWAEAVKELCQADPAFRRSVVPVAAPFGAQQHFADDLFPRLGGMNMQHFLQQRVAETLTRFCTLPSGGLPSIEMARDLHMDTPVARAAGTLCLVTEEGTQAALRFPGGLLRLPVEMMPVFVFLSEHVEFIPASLPSTTVTYDRLKLVHDLIARGFLRLANCSNPS